jgi:hypothetical protein
MNIAVYVNSFERPDVTDNSTSVDKIVKFTKFVLHLLTTTLKRVASALDAWAATQHTTNGSFNSIHLLIF